MQQRWTKPFLIMTAIFGALMPLVLYRIILGRVPTLAARDAFALLDQESDDTVLVDVRETGAFKLEYLQVSQNWPLDEIQSLSSLDQVPDRFQDRTLLLICAAGFSSADATRHLRSLGLENAYNVRGGLQAWKAAWDEPCATSLCVFKAATGESGDLSFRMTPLHEQWIGTIAGFVLKPIYMLISLMLAWVLRREQARDLLALRWAMLLFFAGEACCAVYTLSYLLFRQESWLFEYLHGYGMVLAFAFTTYALIEGLDSRTIRLSSLGKRCAALDLCGPCIKYQDVPCGARRLFLLLTPFLAILSVIPLLVPFNTPSYNTYVLGTFYNYAHLAIHQAFELRYNPVVALVAFLLAFLVLLIRKNRPAPRMAKILFSAGLGAFGFSFFRLLLGTIFWENLVWFDFWEELTELLYMATVAYVLWVFRHRLLRVGTLLGVARLPAELPGGHDG